MIAKALDARLVQLDPANAADVPVAPRRLQHALARRDEQVGSPKAAPLRGRKVVVHHISWVYLWDWLGIDQIGALEPKPGVPPTAAHMSGLIG